MRTSRAVTTWRCGVPWPKRVSTSWNTGDNWRALNFGTYTLEAKAIGRTLETRRRCAPMGVGFTWSPVTSFPWFTWQARRGLGGNLPMDWVADIRGIGI